MIGQIESGNLKIRILANNATSITLQTDKKFNGKVIQPQFDAVNTIGEHGLGMSVTVFDDEKSHLFLFDTGSIKQSIVGNIEALGVKYNEIEKIILSHGHFDHFGGLTAIIPKLNEGTKIYLNSACFDQYHIIFTTTGEKISAEELGSSLETLKKDGKVKHRKLELLDKKVIYNLANKNKIEIIETSVPMKLHEGMIISGEIEIFDEDEVSKGFYSEKSPQSFKEHTFRDETSLYINIKDKGLAILTGCGHVGIINTIKHAQKITGINKVYALIGGFHKENQRLEAIESAVGFIEHLDPKITCGVHCTGFEFNRAIRNHSSHTLGVVGTEFRL
ncbi:MAG: MBL fold metallo-hydrolase [Promethearchaeota archaeon]|jgi:7,8-dihydropterin-6-yl-methyl-4-(beta-D-ribofuranosyl)aminobenzene 5'-phosphate synthase